MKSVALLALAVLYLHSAVRYQRPARRQKQGIRK